MGKTYKTIPRREDGRYFLNMRSFQVPPVHVHPGSQHPLHYKPALLWSPFSPEIRMCLPPTAPTTAHSSLVTSASPLHWNLPRALSLQARQQPLIFQNVGLFLHKDLWVPDTWNHPWHFPLRAFSRNNKLIATKLPAGLMPTSFSPYNTFREKLLY